SCSRSLRIPCGTRAGGNEEAHHKQAPRNRSQHPVSPKASGQCAISGTPENSALIQLPKDQGFSRACNCEHYFAACHTRSIHCEDGRTCPVPVNQRREGMKIARTTLRLFTLATLMAGGLAASLPLQAQNGPPPRSVDGPPRFPMTIPADPRVEERTYVLAATGEEMRYNVFVSSKVDPENPAPLIVALHGMGGDANFIVRDRLVDLAEENGYVVVGPMGYNEVGWYGSPVIAFGPNGVEPANLAELSELDVLNVAAIATSEFNIDPNRTYLLGHSMGGAGTFYLGQKHADRWAAIASIAPAAFMMQPTQEKILAPLKDAGVPVMLTEGAEDNVVPPDTVRTWAAAMEKLEMKHEYHEMEGLDHGTIIGASMPEIFRFFAENVRTPPPTPMPPRRPEPPQ
ncbi:MAG TPA: alpha/beta hydrolase, partial [Sphingomonadaceae bacterium]|nr:alpha/beta hydrolase [Sphingomonadaceae bacterium]